MNLHDWIDEVCDALDIELDLDEALVLDLARDAAHEVERAAAPVTTYLLGFAAAQHESSPEEIERLANEVSELAKRWDRPGDDESDDGVDSGVDDVDDAAELDTADDLYDDEPDED